MISIRKQVLQNTSELTGGLKNMSKPNSNANVDRKNI